MRRKVRIRPLIVCFALATADSWVGAQEPVQPDPAPPTEQTPTTVAKPSADADPTRDREQAIADQLLKELQVGEALQLGAEGERFLGLFTASAGEKKGGVLLLHGLGDHPNSAGAIRALRTRLPAGGWATLAIQLPNPAPHESRAAYGGLVEKAVARTRLGVDYLRQQQVGNVVLIGHDLGAVIALVAAVEPRPSEVKALVTLGLAPADDLEPSLDVFAALAGNNLPLLDIYGGMDSKQVMASRARRANAARNASAGVGPYEQLQIDGATHEFNAVGDELVKRVRGWLQRLLQPTSVRRGP